MSEKFELVCENCHQKFLVSRSVFYRRKKEPHCYCRKCHIKLIGSQSEAYKKIPEKVKKTNLERYGVPCTLQVKDVQDKIKKTCLEKYGCEFAQSSDIVKKKIEESNLERYGVKCTFNSEAQKEKTKKVLLEKYGVDNIAKLDTTWDKIKHTCLEKYGVESINQVPEIRSRQRAKYHYDGILFDSKQEVYFYKELKKRNIKFEYQKRIPEPYYTEDGKEHYTIVDFYVNGQYIEIKGDHLLNKCSEPIGIFGSWWEKYELLRKYKTLIVRASLIEKFVNIYL